MSHIQFSPWVSNLGWTLLHSLWQGTAIATLYFIVLQVFPETRASARYLLSTGSLIIILVCAISTFIYLQSNIPGKSQTTALYSAQSADFHAATTLDTSSLSLAEKTGRWIDSNAFGIVMVWLCGVFIFCVRLWAAWSYSSGLRKKATPVVGYWKEQLSRLAQDLNIKSKIILAECGAVVSPIVFGVFKPIILLPVGMLSGLSAEQVESILLHELAHLRRHDFVVNIFQSVMEALFFFNPFVWIFSTRMKNERELCCDDIVVKFRNPLVYARALHQLESSRIENSPMALAATGNKNQLLNRIKRIMETNQNTEKRSRKMIPAVLIIILLTAASWLSVKAYQPEKIDGLVQSDTVIRGQNNDKKKPKSRDGRQLVTADHATGAHDEKVNENDTSDLRLVFSHVESFPEIPEAPEAPEIPLAFAETPEPIEIPELEFTLHDTIPELMNLRVSPDLEEFNKQFAEQFSQKFGDFYKKNGPEMQKMMKELAIKLEQETQQLVRMNGDIVEMRSEAQWNRMDDSTTPEQLALLKQRAQADAMRAYADSQRQYAESSQRCAESQSDVVTRALATKNLQLAEMMATADKEAVDDMTNPSNKFNQQLREELVKDQYFKTGEALTGIEMSDDDIKFNDKPIKDKDKAKYRNMYKDYVKGKLKDRNNFLERELRDGKRQEKREYKDEVKEKLRQRDGESQKEKEKEKQKEATKARSKVGKAE